MPDLKYPPVGFHFLVTFTSMPSTPNDMRFMEVSGLNVEMEMETFKEGGVLNYVHQLPVRSKYDDLTLKRGFLTGSLVRKWLSQAFDNFIFQPVNLMVTLLDEHHAPLYSWDVIGAIPKKWQVSNFNASDNGIVVETLILSYRYCRLISPETIA